MQLNYCTFVCYSFFFFKWKLNLFSFFIFSCYPINTALANPYELDKKLREYSRNRKPTDSDSDSSSSESDDESSDDSVCLSWISFLLYQILVTKSFFF